MIERVDADAFASMQALIPTIVMDCMEYGEWKNGVRMEGRVNSVLLISQKVGKPENKVSVSMAEPVKPLSTFQAPVAGFNRPAIFKTEW
ncbi:MAG: hypothetical protein ABIK68_09180 [bacterium]